MDKDILLRSARYHLGEAGSGDMPQAVEPPIRSKCIVLRRLEPVWRPFSLQVSVYIGLVGCNSHFVPCGSFVEFPAVWSTSDNPHVLGGPAVCSVLTAHVDGDHGAYNDQQEEQLDAAADHFEPAVYLVATL